MYKINPDRKMWDLWAKRWDFLLSVIGYDIAYRKEAVDRLSLNRGSIVLDLACGTGLNFEHIEEKIGIKGKIIALVFSSEMLKKAEEKIEENGWQNIKILERDASDLSLDEKVDAVLCTWAMVSIMDFEKSIQNSVKYLKERGRFVVLDFQLMTGIKGLILNPLYILIFKIFNQDLTRKPWETIKKHLRKVKK